MCSECPPHTNAYGCVCERRKERKDEREKESQKKKLEKKSKKKNEVNNLFFDTIINSISDIYTLLHQRSKNSSI